MKHRSLFFILFVLLIQGCCKEPIPGGLTLIGTWLVTSIDSTVLLPPAWDDPWEFEGYPMVDTGRIEFDRDSSGYLYGPIRKITDGDSSFFWHHDKLGGLIDFSFNYGTTIAVIDSLSETYIKLYLRKFLVIYRELYMPTYYRIQMIKLLDD